MQRGNLDDLLAFVAVARERSFTKAAAKLGVSQSALSHTIRGLEARLGVRLLTRTTRSVSPTAGGRAPARHRGARGSRRSRPSSRPSATCATSPPAPSASRPATMPSTRSSGRSSPKFLPKYPDIKVEIIVDYGLTDIVAQRYDAGVRFGEQVAKDMIAVRIGPDIRFALVGAPSYFAKRRRPRRRRTWSATTASTCACRPMAACTPGSSSKAGRELKVRVDGQLVFNGIFQVLNAALAGFGLAYVPEDLAQPHIAEGRLKRVLEDWCPPLPGYHLYYPSRRQPSPAFALLVDALRYRG